MRFAIAAAALALPAILSPVEARQPECPVEWGEVDQAIEEAPTCLEAGSVLDACLVGASADVSRAHRVREICERDFLVDLGPAARRSYDAALRRCDRKHSRDDGSLYRSMEATCAADLARSYSGRALTGRR